MKSAIRFPFLQKPGGSGPLDLQPLLPLSLEHGRVSLDVVGLVDSGATISVLPYDVGVQLGFSWNRLKNSVQIGGALSPNLGKMLYLTARISTLQPVQLAFAWIKSNSCPVVLGLANFLFHFDVFLSRRHSYFEIQPATP